MFVGKGLAVWTRDPVFEKVDVEDRVGSKEAVNDADWLVDDDRVTVDAAVAVNTDTYIAVTLAVSV